MQIRSGIFGQGALLVLLALVLGAASAEETPREASGGEVSREMALAQLAEAQQRLDAARARVADSEHAGGHAASLDLAQKLLDQARAQLLARPGSREAERAREGMLATAEKLQQSLATSIQRVTEEAGLEIDAAAALSGEASGSPLSESDRSARIRKVFETARRQLDAARSRLASASQPDPILLRKLEEAERALEKARRDAVANGLLR